MSTNINSLQKNPKFKREVYNTEDSQGVTHQSTNPAQHYT